MRVLLADDHALVRAAIRALLRTMPEVTEVVEAADGREALDMAAKHRPDLILMDVTMPGLNGLEAMSRIAKDAPATRIVVLSMHHNEEYVRRALRYGASGYVVKDAAPAELEFAIRAAIRGDVYLSPAVTRSLIAEPVPSGQSSLEQLSSRQRQVLQLIAEGHDRQAMARILGVAVKTIETHRTELMKQLGIHEVAGLVRYAIRTGVVAAE
jgi:DNA-binding NarL/FixJ family response regulator